MKHLIFLGFLIFLLGCLSLEGVEEINIEAQDLPIINFTAPEFSLPSLNGGNINLEDYYGKVVVLNFWASWCPSCRFEAPELERVWKKYQSENFVLIGINNGEDKKDIENFVKEFNITYPIALDSKAELTFLYGVRVIPTTVLVSREGKIAFMYEGPLSEEQLISLISYVQKL